MKCRVALVAILLLSSASSGCYRTRYVNLRSAGLGLVPPALPQAELVSRWQHFFVYGWVPGERVIDAAKACGGPEKVQSIETRQTLAQGLIYQFAGTIYAPYSGEVLCEEAIRR